MGSSTPSSPVGNPYAKKIDYNYDDDANRTSVVVTPYQQSPSTTSYTTNNLNEYTAVGGTTHVWDANGNLTDNGTLKFEYNHKNLIVKVRKKSDSALFATYRYDALGRRVEKDTGDVERYIRSTVLEPGDRDNISHVVSVYDGFDNWLQNFVWNDETDGIQMLEQVDVLDYDTDGNTTEVTRSFYHRNALGSVIEITDLNQATAVSYRYDPYGKVTITRGGTPQTSDPLGQHWTFTGRFLDEESSLMYYRARHYDPGIGRFLQRDPLGYVQGPSLFTYSTSNPTSVRDPSGMKEKKRPQRGQQKRLSAREIMKKLDRVTKAYKGGLYKLSRSQLSEMSRKVFIDIMKGSRKLKDLEKQLGKAEEKPAVVGGGKDDNTRNTRVNLKSKIALQKYKLNRMIMKKENLDWAIDCKDDLQELREEAQKEEEAKENEDHSVLVGTGSSGMSGSPTQPGP